MYDSAIPWSAACQASLSFTIFWSLLKLMSIESMMPSNHLIHGVAKSQTHDEQLNWTELMELDAMILVFWMLSFKAAFSFSSFTFTKSLFSSSSLSTIRVVLSAYLRLLILLPTILIPACASSSPAFLMMYSVQKLNKQGDNTQPWRTPFPILNQSVVSCTVLTVASWPAYGLLRRPVR